MKQSKKHKHKKSYSSSSSSPSRSQSLSNKHKRKNKSKHNKQHKRKRSRSNQKRRSRSQSNKKKIDNQINRQSHKHQDKYTHKQRNDLYSKTHNHQISNQNKLQPKKYQKDSQQDNIKQSPISRQQIPLQNEQGKPQKQLPCFQPSGILLEYYNARDGVSLRFHQPPQSRQPDQQWRIYIFKGEEVLKPIIMTKSCYLVGKDERVVDILAENPSISRQHAVLQFRLVQKRQTQGDFVQEVKPYVMDLESTNGTLLNDEKIQPGRYYQLLHRDVLKFGFSDREYVIVKWDQGQQQEDC